jgi:RNA polymerase sigma-B factor
MPLARSLALRYRGTSESIDDLCQVAYLGLIKAVDGFDPRRGRSFTTYAVPTILGELRRHFRDRVWNLRLPRSLQERTATVDDVMAQLGDQLGRAPTVAEVAERAELEVEEVLEAISAGEARRTLSLDMPRTHEEEADPVIETLGATDLSYDAVEAQIAAPEAHLDERELLVLRLRFGANKTQYEIGTRLGVSQMQVSRTCAGRCASCWPPSRAIRSRPGSGPGRARALPDRAATLPLHGRAARRLPQRGIKVSIGCLPGLSLERDDRFRASWRTAPTQVARSREEWWRC